MANEIRIIASIQVDKGNLIFPKIGGTTRLKGDTTTVNCFMFVFED